MTRPSGFNRVTKRPVRRRWPGWLAILLAAACVQSAGGRVRTRASEDSRPGDWKPVPDRISAPASGVSLDDGVFKQMFANNIGYLLSSFSVNQMLRPFRVRAGEKEPPAEPYPKGFWGELPGSCAGRFMMGAGGTLNWVDEPELRRRLNELVEGIDRSKRPDGYIMAYPEGQFTYSEYGNYVRSWVTLGLIAAGSAGNKDAYALLRGYYDWFDQCPYLPEARNLRLGYQGMTPNTCLYFSPAGKAKDIEVIQRYYTEDWWLDELIAHDPRAIWDRPTSTPHTHCYEITALEAYLDLYRATGEKRYLDAVLGGWDLFHDNWIHVGGSIAICEGPKYPPKSYYLENHTGELCCSVFWVLLNQRLHQLYPDQEKYVNQIEQSIYNVALANQDGKRGIRYHAVLHARKEAGEAVNTCCEGAGTRLYAMLPKFIYSEADDGLYVNLYSASTIHWTESGHRASLKMVTGFPLDDAVQLKLELKQPTPFILHIRIPTWASHPVPVSVNGKVEATGQPGTYLTLSRTWATGDAVSFALPRELRITRYTGYSQIVNTERYAIEYGTLLMAFVGPFDYKRCVGIRQDAQNFKSWLVPVHGAVTLFREGSATVRLHALLASDGSALYVLSHCGAQDRQ